MPLLHQTVLVPFRSDGEAVELPGQADREIADVDHLLHFAFRLDENLAGFKRDESGQVRLALAQHGAKPADRFAAHRSWRDAPSQKGFARPFNCVFVIRGGRGSHATEDLTVDW